MAWAQNRIKYTCLELLGPLFRVVISRDCKTAEILYGHRTCLKGDTPVKNFNMMIVMHSVPDQDDSLRTLFCVFIKSLTMRINQLG